MSGWLYWTAALATSLFAAAYLLGCIFTAIDANRVCDVRLTGEAGRRGAVAFVVCLVALGIAMDISP